MRRPWMTALLTLLIIGGGAVFITTAVHALWYAPDSTGPAQTAMATTTEAAPVRLRIPSLGISASVQKLGINAIGNMQAPSNFTDVGWYRYGPRPGERGSAVMDGHVDNGLGLDGVFKHLKDIAVGDDLYIETASSTTIHFVVSDVVTYPYQDVPTDLIFNRADTARLNLITCEGAWLGGERTYDRRLVVYAVRAP